MPTLERTPPLVQFFVRMVRWLKTKYSSGVSQTPPLHVVGQISLGAKRHLSLVEVGGVQFLVGGGVEHVTVIVPVSTSDPGQTTKPQEAGQPPSL
ncbi:MAG TPA: flagellar biosynthetic protein FliO [Acidobacteriaceae bacterium]|nr:flagellar biosynthetic protein FliO [Acidobacteriaceae bacterium]